MGATLARPATSVLWRTTTVRQFGRALLAAGLAIVAGCAIYVVEKYVLAAERRFIENPSDVMMRAFALGHFLIGWLFLLTTPRIRRPSNLLRLGLAAAAGVVVCLAFAAHGGTSNPLLVMLFWGYFLVHEVRDESELFRSYGDAPEDGPEQATLRNRIRNAAMFMLMTVLLCGYTLYATATGKNQRLGFPTFPAVGLAVIVLAMLTAWMVWRARRQAQENYGDWRAAVAAYAPLIAVYSGILFLLAAGTVLGSTGFNLIILVHVTAWMVFVAYRLEKSPRRSVGLWGWLRQTPAGFLTLHLAVVAAILVLMALRVHLWEKAGPVSVLLASSNFVYWGLMHISIAFAPPR